MELEQKAQQVATAIATLLHIQCAVFPEEDDGRAFVIEPAKTLSYGAVMGAVFLKFGGAGKPDRRQVKSGEDLIFKNTLTRLGVKIYCVCDRYAFVKHIIVEEASNQDLGDVLIRNITSRLQAASTKEFTFEVRTQDGGSQGKSTMAVDAPDQARAWQTLIKENKNLLKYIKQLTLLE